MNPQIGSCSWNYDSWKNLVYSENLSTAAEYLSEYSTKFSTVEIDSWFYKLPNRYEVLDYLSYSEDNLKFTCKISNKISLTHLRPRKSDTELRVNPTFLSVDLFKNYLESIAPMLPRIDAVMLEFEYLNKQKMQSQENFMRALEDFIKDIPADIPLAVECRNGNYLNEEYFQFIEEKRIIHVFSEKIYMPRITEIYERFGSILTDSTVIRLLGGDRRAIEKTTEKKWNRIVEPKDELITIIQMTKDLISRGKKVTINVNNHYEGSAPLTIRRIKKLLQ